MEPPGTAGAPGAAGRPWEDAKAFYDNLAPKKKPKSPKPENAITIAVSSRALFRMEEEQKIYNEQGVEAYVKYQLDHENEPFLPGAAFPFVKALEAVNTQLRELYPDSEELFDIVLMTNNHAQVGVRLINSINHYDLFIERFCMTGGNSPICYLKAYHTNLYLSSDAEKVSGAIEEGIAAATIFSPSKDLEVSENQLRVAFDGDAVLFSDESEQIVKAHGLDMFFEHEKAHENKPLAQGPLKGFLEALGKLQKKFYSKGLRMECPIRTYLVTARSAASSGARALKTLRSWGLETDEALFLAGAPKGPLLKKIRPHIFFDDQMFHVEGAKEMGTVAAHVPYGVAQKHKRPAQEKQPQNSNHVSRSVSPTTTSQIQARKKRRGIIEKRRRDRINSSLSELRRLVPTAFEKQGSSKLEKAEILQMTVDHLKMLHATGGAGFLDARALAVDYRSIGFRECLTEVVRYLGILEGQNTADPIRLRLLSHLNNYVAEMEPSPVATSLLPIQTWPWSFLHGAAGPVQVPRREAAPAPLVVTASSLAYPSPAVRPAPLRRVPGDMLPSRRSLLAGRMASSSRRARGTGSSAAVAAVPRMPSPTGVLREGSSKGSQIATFLFSPASAGVPVPPAYAAPGALGAAVQGPGIRVGASRICRSWATEIGAF